MKRPVFLTIWLVLMTISGLFSLYSYTLGFKSIVALLPTIPSWLQFVFIGLNLANLASIYFLWTWKKMGFNIVLVTAVISVGLNFFVLGSGSIGTIIFGLLGVLILYLAMKPVWENFN